MTIHAAIPAETRGELLRTGAAAACRLRAGHGRGRIGPSDVGDVCSRPDGRLLEKYLRYDVECQAVVKRIGTSGRRLAA